MLPTKDPRASEVLSFWFGADGEYGKRRRQWFAKSAEFDTQVRTRCFALHEQAAAARLGSWEEATGDSLALVVLLDQVSRNLFRGEARAFASDALARDAARRALARGYDRDALPVERMFFYLPFMHSEALEDQRFACELARPLAKFAETEDVFGSAERHRDVIERFGRFPHRNSALGRESTTEEREFLVQPGSSF